MIKIEKTGDITPENNIVMIVYGRGGVGKTSFAASAPKPLMIDFENGSKFLGSRGINIDVWRTSKWVTTAEKKELLEIIKEYDSIILDPIGEAMELLIESSEIRGNKYRTSDGSPTMAGWGEIKKQMKNFIKWLRSTGKNIILVAHDNEVQTENGLHHRVMIATKLSQEIVNMVDVVSYIMVQKKGNEAIRVLYTPHQGESFDSKDRFDRIPDTVKISKNDGWNDFMQSMKPAVFQEEVKRDPYEMDKDMRKQMDNKIADYTNLATSNRNLFSDDEWNQLVDVYSEMPIKAEKEWKSRQLHPVAYVKNQIGYLEKKISEQIKLEQEKVVDQESSEEEQELFDLSTLGRV